jgi:hypothetical protein
MFVDSVPLIFPPRIPYIFPLSVLTYELSEERSCLIIDTPDSVAYVVAAAVERVLMDVLSVYTLLEMDPDSVEKLPKIVLPMFADNPLIVLNVIVAVEKVLVMNVESSDKSDNFA